MTNKPHTIGNKSYIIIAIMILVIFFSTATYSYTFLVSTLGALIAIYALDNYMIFSRRYPYIWQVIKWCALLTIIMLTLIGLSY